MKLAHAFAAVAAIVLLAFAARAAEPKLYAHAHDAGAPHSSDGDPLSLSAATKGVPFSLLSEAQTAEAATYAAHREAGGVQPERTVPNQLSCIDYEEANFCSGWENGAEGFGFYCYPGQTPSNCTAVCSQYTGAISGTYQLPLFPWPVYQYQIVANSCPGSQPGGAVGSVYNVGSVNPATYPDFGAGGSLYLDACTLIVSPDSDWTGSVGVWAYWYSPNDKGGPTGYVPPGSYYWMLAVPIFAAGKQVCSYTAIVLPI
jgi:hypothetical protein